MTPEAILGAREMVLAQTIRAAAGSPLFWAMVLGAVGLWLMLPPASSRRRIFGAVVATASVGLFASRVPLLGDWAAEGVFWILAGVTVAAAAATISMRSPVYSAVWFGLSVLGTASLMLLSGAQFLAVATVVVYAGAILVTVLFVLMLASPEGRTAYDRLGWGSLPAACSALAGAVLVGVLSVTLAGIGGRAQNRMQEQLLAPRPDAVDAAGPDVPADQNHVAHLGGRLFSLHLVSVELAGTLLLASLVGAVAIAIRGREPPAREGGPSDG